MSNGIPKLKTNPSTLLTPRHKALRLAEAREHRLWKLNGWKRVLWSDESRFQLFHADGSLCVWRKTHEVMDPVFQERKIQGWRQCFAVMWSVFSWHALYPLIYLQTSMNGGCYVSIFADHLHPFMTCMHSAESGFIHHDNALVHGHQIWLEVHSSEFGIMIWSSSSSDFSAIEHI